LKVLVSTISAPAAKYWPWMPSIMSGRVRESRSLLPFKSCGWLLKRSPRKSASLSGCCWIIVPIAPSRRAIRCSKSARNASVEALAEVEWVAALMWEVEIAVGRVSSPCTEIIAG
jgi:hypothetical protein